MQKNPATPIRQRFHSDGLIIVATAIPPTFESEARGDERTYEVWLETQAGLPVEGSIQLTHPQFLSFVTALSGSVGQDISDWMASKPALAPLPPRPVAGAIRPIRLDPLPSVDPLAANSLSPAIPPPASSARAAATPVDTGVPVGQPHRELPILTLGDRPLGGGVGPRKPWREVAFTPKPEPTRRNWWKYANEVSRELHREGVFISWKSESGMLGVLGYSTGNSSTLSEKQRREILDIAFTAKLPTVNSREYTEKWGGPRTRQRVLRIAETIAYLLKMGRNRRGCETAVEEWQDDYQWLRNEYGSQVGVYHWPSSYS